MNYIDWVDANILNILIYQETAHTQLKKSLNHVCTNRLRKSGIVWAENRNAHVFRKP